MTLRYTGGTGRSSGRKLSAALIAACTSCSATPSAIASVIVNHSAFVARPYAAQLAVERYDVVLCDVLLRGMTGIELCERLRSRKSRATVIVMSAYGNVDVALEAIKAGAYDYVSKPFKPDEIVLALREPAWHALLHRLPEQVRAGRLKLLAVGSPKRSPLFPDVPTLDEAGLKGFDADTVFGFYAPAATPPAIVTRLNQEINRILATASVKDRIQGLGGEALPLTPQEFAAKAVEEIGRAHV